MEVTFKSILVSDLKKQIEMVGYCGTKSLPDFRKFDGKQSCIE